MCKMVASLPLILVTQISSMRCPVFFNAFFNSSGTSNAAEILPLMKLPTLDTINLPSKFIGHSMPVRVGDP